MFWTRVGIRADMGHLSGSTSAAALNTCWDPSRHRTPVRICRSLPEPCQTCGATAGRMKSRFIFEK
ncbi:hypothetical protein C2S52_010038 [Perilla frutescens var. hirtella]|nr:hypothetical protein C2S52_010038 [Perilla frutescens var. hirtella]